jgi:hypothetical protein
MVSQIRRQPTAGTLLQGQRRLQPQQLLLQEVHLLLQWLTIRGYRELSEEEVKQLAVVVAGYQAGRL